MIRTFKDCPLPIIPKAERIKQNTVGICNGSCNRMIELYNTTYNLCSPCSDKYRYYGASCDVPNCESVADGSIGFKSKENKMLCVNCCAMWKNKLNYCAWERLVEERHLWLLRPPKFVKALVTGLIASVENPVNYKEVAKCRGCERYEEIPTPKYQLCSSCAIKFGYYGEKCSVGGTESCPNDAVYFDTQESRFVCNSCAAAKSKYKLSSYAMYETQIRTKTKCRLCSRSVSHNRAEGKKHCSANIDHDHDSGMVRGILCYNCNIVEGQVKRMPIDALTYAKNLVAYLEAPPLSESWMQKT